MSAKKIMSVCLALAMVMAAAPVMAASQTMMDEWNQPMDTSGAKGGAISDGPTALAGSLAPSAHGGSVSKNFDTDEGWVNKNPQGPTGGSADSNFDKETDWK